MRKALFERLDRYARIDTTADEFNPNCPSSPGQMDLAHLLAEELKAIGMTDVTVDEYAYVMATLPSNIDKDVPVIGFIAHMDTARDFNGTNVNPQLLENYDGSDIVLNQELDIVMTNGEFPNLKNYIGHDLVTTDGTTLLGADNKAGVAEIMTAMEYLIQNPDIEHGKIRVAFTPDEEIGRGPHRFDVEKFGAKYAYTMDGNQLGELQYECFNAATAFITFHGKNVHPGSAKDIMVHSTKMAMEFQSALPYEVAPEHTTGYEGFFHMIDINGTTEKTEVQYIIRDHCRVKFEEKKTLVESIVADMNKKYGAGNVELTLKDMYYNMAEMIEPVKEIVDIVEEAFKILDITPIFRPQRGGTDGSQLSYMGLPTPNLFQGAENFHGKYEFASLQDMEKATKVIIEVIKLYAQK